MSFLRGASYFFFAPFPYFLRENNTLCRELILFANKEYCMPMVNSDPQSSKLGNFLWPEAKRRAGKGGRGGGMYLN